MKLVKEETNCSGCGLCAELCKRNAIHLTIDSKGFYYPSIDTNKCIDCNLCKRECVFENEEKTDEQTCFAAKARDVGVQIGCSSGGIAHVIVEECIEKGYAVFACVMENNQIIHRKISYASEADGSKYVQSNMQSCYMSIKQELTNGKNVLFIGVACQVAAIQRYVERMCPERKGNLMTVDILCHGVPSPGVFESYLKWVENRYHSTIEDVIFRSKEKGWRFCTSGNYILLSDGNKASLELFYQLYFGHIILRESCTKCPFNSMSRPSDITLSDFWNIKEYLPAQYDDNGVSRILVNSEKGKKLLDMIREQVFLEKCDISCCDNVKQFHLHPQMDEKGQKRFFAWYRKNPIKAFSKMKQYYFLLRVSEKVKRIFKNGKKNI